MPATPDQPVRVIALMNQKGGVGKTTTTVNLAAAIAELDRSVLIIDLDPQAHATLHVGVEPETETGADGETVNGEPGRAPTVYDLLLDPSIGLDACVRRVSDRLSILPAETDLAAAETELAGVPDRNRRLATALEAAHARYEFVLLDCPPGLGLLTLNALTAAQEVIIPMQAHFLALQGVGKLLETVRVVRDQVNPDLRVAGVVLCMHDTQVSHSREVVDDLGAFFEGQRDSGMPWAHARVYRPAIRRNIKLAECPSFGQTIFQYAPWAPGAADYRELADSVVAEWDRAVRQAQLSEAEIRVLRGQPEPIE